MSEEANEQKGVVMVLAIALLFVLIGVIGFCCLIDSWNVDALFENAALFENDEFYK